ncbi:MAG: exo-beta-N-acetylmuramidase NamZ family protein, partial [Nocardioidaceae bacterium]
YEAVRGDRVGIITNPTGILPDLSHEVDVMAGDDGIDLVAVFGPEHGFRGTGQAGDSSGSYTDPRTGLPVYDTYGKTPAEIAAYFDDAGVDAVMFDIQDVGARFYTYIWTMYDSMCAAARSGTRFVVLDRPNPITGDDAYGPVLHEEYATFVGRKPIAQQHGMTVAELAQLFNAEFLPGDPDSKHSKAELDVVRMRGWHRRMGFDETGLPWVMPSPNMPTVDTAWVYPGTCMFEGTNESEGRGTTRPFELVGAPYVDQHWAQELGRLELPGASFRETYFAPTFSKHKGETCGGVQLYVTDQRHFDAIHAAVAMLVTANDLYAGEFEWRYDSWDDEHPYWIDKLTGSGYVRHAIDAGKSPEDVVAGWQAELDDFRATRSHHLLYH